MASFRLQSLQLNFNLAFMERILPNSKALNTVMELAEGAARLRGADFVFTPYVLYAIAVETPGYWRRLKLSPQRAIKYANDYWTYDPPAPKIILPSPRTREIGIGAKALANAEGAEMITIGHWLTTYFKNDEWASGPFRDTPFHAGRINKIINGRHPFSNEPKTLADELLREALDEKF